MLADGLDRLRQRDGPLLEDGAAGSLHGIGNVDGRHRAEELARLAGLRRNVDGERLELLLDLIGMCGVTDLANLAGALDLRDLLLATSRPRDGESTRDEVVAAIAVLDGDDIASGTESADFLREDELHLCIPPSEQC